MTRALGQVALFATTMAAIATVGAAEPPGRALHPKAQATILAWVMLGIIIMLGSLMFLLILRQARHARQTARRKRRKGVGSPWEESARRLTLPRGGDDDDGTVDLDPSDLSPDDIGPRDPTPPPPVPRPKPPPSQN